MGETCDIVHKRRALGENGVVVRVLDFVDVLALMGNVGPVVDGIVFRIDEACFLNPVPRLFCPVGIFGVSCVAGKPGRHVEEAAVGDA